MRVFLFAILAVAVFASCSGGGRSSGSGITPPTEAKRVRPLSVSQIHTYEIATNARPSVTVLLSPKPAQGDTEIAVVYGYNTSGQCYTLATPSAWAMYDSTCAGNSRNTIWTLSHIAGANDTSYTFALSDSSDSDYFSVVVYDLSGVVGIDGHADQAFTSGYTQTTASLTPTESGDFAIASFANAYSGSPTISSPWTIDDNITNGVYLTTAHDVLSGTGATSATATYPSATAAPASGESNLLLLSGYVPPIVQNQPLLRVVSETGIPSGTAELYYGQIASSSACPGRALGAGYGCQSYPNYSYFADYCEQGGSVPDLAEYAQANSDESWFLHTTSPIGSGDRDTQSSSDSQCGNYGLSSDTYYFMNLGNASAASWLASNVLNSSSTPANGAFFDGYSWWYGGGADQADVEYGGSGSSCSGYPSEPNAPSCDHPWISGGLDNQSFETALAVTMNDATGFHFLVNNINLPEAGSPCEYLTTQNPVGCIGGQYNPGTFDSRVRFDELCGALTQNDLDMLRAEASQTEVESTTVNPQLGIDNAVMLNTDYWLQKSTGKCAGTTVLLQESDVDTGARWAEDDISAMQWLAPSSDGTGDGFAQNPYPDCPLGCTNEFPIYPDALIVPYGPAFATTAYAPTYSAPRDATNCNKPGISDGADTTGAASRVIYCQAAGYPVFDAPYNHCFFVQYDLGPCVAIFNTGTAAVKLLTLTPYISNLSNYAYYVSFSGDEWGSASSMGGSGAGNVAQMFPWLSTSSGLYTALSTEASSCSNTNYCNGEITFSAQPTNVPANSAIFLTMYKPPNY